MNVKEFAAMMDDVVGKTLTQAYTDHAMTGLTCERKQRAFRYVLCNGYFKLGVDCYGGQVGCWWTGALSLKPHELVLGDMRDICYEKAFCCQVREFLWSCVHRMNDMAGKHRCSGFVWPAVRPIEEYVEAGNVDVFAGAVSEIYADEQAEFSEESDIGLGDVSAQEDTVPDEPKKKKLFFGRKRRGSSESECEGENDADDIASLGDDHVHPEFAADYFKGESLDELEGV